MEEVVLMPDDPDAEGQRWRDMEITLDVLNRATEWCEGRDGISGHRSGIEIVFCNQSLWGIKTTEELRAAIDALVATNPYWFAHYERRAQLHRQQAEAFLTPDVIARLKEKIRLALEQQSAS